MSCKSCGRALLPFHELCSGCGATVQDATSARAKKLEWDALTPALQEELRRDYEAQVTSRRQWLEWLRAQRRMHAALGAGLYGVPAALIFSIMGGPVWILIPASLIDLAAGAGLGFLLNRLLGGPYRGMALFAAAFAVEASLRAGGVAIFGSGFGGAGIAIVMFSGFLFVSGAGYAFGLQLTMDRSDLGA